MKRKEVIIFAVVFVLAAAAALVLHLTRKKPLGYYDSIWIYTPEAMMGPYSLGDNQKISINGTNVCEIKNGGALMIEASCPDHLCMTQFAIDSEHGGMIVCLPNQVMIEAIHTGPEPESENAAAPVVDAVAD